MRDVLVTIGSGSPVATGRPSTSSWRVAPPLNGTLVAVEAASIALTVAKRSGPKSRPMTGFAQSS
jgi:hypothetical protein